MPENSNRELVVTCSNYATENSKAAEMFTELPRLTSSQNKKCGHGREEAVVLVMKKENLMTACSM